MSPVEYFQYFSNRTFNFHLIVPCISIQSPKFFCKIVEYTSMTEMPRINLINLMFKPHESKLKLC